MRSYQRALITGATSGIGAAFASELSVHTDLLLTGRNNTRLEHARQRHARPQRLVRTVMADLTQGHDLDAVVGEAEAFGLDLLINNAGAGTLGRVIDNALDAELDAVRLNVTAVVALTRRLLPGMLARARNRGRRAGLIIVSSTAAFVPVPFLATYGASKAFELHFAEALAEELRGEPVDVLVLCPGATRTDFALRAGFHSGPIPGARDPRYVAREALLAIGRETVHISGTLSAATFSPAVFPRRALTGALGLAMRILGPNIRPRSDHNCTSPKA
ncbi:MAG: SDR family NAD(P)-dependent oxidoreductase [Hyphomicrobiales bacterium]|nr:SDR family NAD(P)-dependent oxidoreductase [Hyphomicrobiales bacterium]